jgi:endonuclease/exonuclease/phosphatase family metal-dependent hydrolase
MTYNVNEGTDYLEVQAATTQEQFLIAVGETITQVRATDPPARMQAVAQQIVAAAPTIVSLQELDQWSTGSFDPVSEVCGATSVEFDMVQELLDALGAEGGHYDLAVEGQEFAFPPTPGLILPGTFLCVAVVDYNAILVRTDLNTSQFQWSNPQSALFASEVVLATPEGDIPIPRSWVSIDASFHQRPFRVIGSHLETSSASIRQAQAAELRAGPANTALPVIVAMDGNAQAFPLPEDPAYTDFLTAGYVDAWSSLYPTSPGLTCCQAQLDNNPVSQLTSRIDLILSFGGITPKQAALFGADPASKTPEGLWPSDHAAVEARLRLAK